MRLLALSCVLGMSQATLQMQRTKVPFAVGNTLGAAGLVPLFLCSCKFCSTGGAVLCAARDQTVSGHVVICCHPCIRCAVNIHQPHKKWQSTPAIVTCIAVKAAGRRSTFFVVRKMCLVVGVSVRVSILIKAVTILIGRSFEIMDH